MKFYLASSFAQKPRLEVVHAMLTIMGHEVPDVWWNTDAKDVPARDDRDWQSLPLIRSIAHRHWNTIMECDAVIIVAPAVTPVKFTGANIEAGFAMGIGRTVFSVGVLERSAMYAPVIQCHDVAALRECIEVFSREAR